MIVRKELLNQALNQARYLGVDYADIRLKDIVLEKIQVENGQVTNLSANRSCGAGVRVFVKGAMGFASTSDISNLHKAVQVAYETALSSAMLLGKKVTLSPKRPVVAQYSTPIMINPFSVPLEEKLELLTTCSNVMSNANSSAKNMSFMDFRQEDVIYADTDGSYITQTFYQSGGGISCTAVSKTDSQRRSYGNILRAGYEVIQNLQLPQRAETISRESAQLIDAPDCPRGKHDLVIMPSQLFLQIHESVGHPTELDRVLGSEVAFAGASFLTKDDIHKNLRYGSEHVTITADAVDCWDEGGLGTFGYDDEGVPAQSVTLIDKGIFKNFQTSRDNSPIIGQASHGMGLSDGWQFLPLVRMTNINLQPGTYSIGELISEVDNGLLLQENKSWSIDDKRVNFQFSCEIAREISDGRLTGRIFKNPTYTGNTTEFWGSCDGVCSKEFRKMVGVPNCGKGQPMQIMRVAHASPPARFRGVQMI